VLRLLGGATHGELAVVVEPLLGHAEAGTRDYALEQLLDLDFQDGEVRNVLLSGLARGRVEVRKGILRSMEDLSEAQVRSILPGLIRVIQEDRDAEVREKAIWVATKPFSSVPRELVPALEKAMRDPSERVRTAAAGVMNRAQGQAMEQRLGEIVQGTKDAGVAPALAKALLEDSSQRVRVRASMALGKLPVRDASEEVIRALVQAIGQDKSAAVRAAACATLSRRTYRSAEATLPALTAALNDPDEVVRAEAAEGLRQVKAR
jgi:HEAT repeat protein